MKNLHRIVKFALAAFALANLAACSSLTTGQQDAATGAGIGSAAGSILTGGSSLGRAGGSVLGGTIGGESGKTR